MEPQFRSSILIATDIQNGILNPLEYGQRCQPELLLANAERALSIVRGSTRLQLMHVAQVPLVPSHDPAPLSAEWHCDAAMDMAEAVSPLRFSDRAFFHFHDRVAPRTGEHLFCKRGFDMFDDGRLTAWLSGRGIDRIILAGIKTDRCIAIAASHAARIGFSVAVLFESTATGNIFEKRRQMTEWTTNGIALMTLSELGKEAQ